MCNNLIFFFLAIVLLLVMGLLTACLWCLLLLLRQHLELVEKMSEENTNHAESETVLPACPFGSTLKEQGTKTLEEQPKKSSEQTNHNMVHISEQSIEEDSEEICEDINTKVLEFMRRSPKNNCTRLKAVSKAFSGYLEEYELIEDPTGKLIMIQGKSGECIVFPESESIGEKEYEYCGVKGCYETNISVRSGYYYRIIQIPELCTVKKSEDKYMIQSKGKLTLEQK